MIEITKHESGIKSFYIDKPGYKLTLLNVGAAIWKLETANEKGDFENIVISFKNAKQYLLNETFQGTVVGRNAGRIENGSYVSKGLKIDLPKNNGPNNLHSSNAGVSKRIWKETVFENSIEFDIELKSEDDGFPGNIKIKATYEFGEETFRIEYSAKSDEDTLCNLTNHTYFNLSAFNESVLEHELENTFTNAWALTKDNIPLKKMEINKVFNGNNRIKDIIESNKDFFDIQRGFDHPFELDKNKKIILSDSKKERKLIVETSYPYAVIYTQNWEVDELNNELNKGIAIECQYLPNEVNMIDNSKTLLEKDKIYKEWVKYSFK